MSVLDPTPIRAHSTRRIRRADALLVAMTFLLAGPAGAHEAPVPVKSSSSGAVEQIRAAKEHGERYLGMIWHQAEAEYLAARAEAEAAKALHKAGGSGPATATAVLAHPFVDVGSTVGQGNDLMAGSCLSGGADSSEDAWYTVTFTTPVLLQAWIRCASSGGASDFDSRLAVLDQNLALRACNDDAPDCPQPYYQSRISDLLLDPGTYFVVVDGYNGASGTFELHLDWVEDPVVCTGSDASNATEISLLPFTDTSTTVGACDDLLVDCELQTASSGPDRWYRVAFDVSVLLDVRTACEAGALDTRVAVLDASLQTLFCNDDDPLCPTHQSEIEQATLDPGEYYIVVDSPEGEGGAYTVEIDTTHAPVGPVRALLPDIVVIENDLYDHVIDTNVVAGRTHLRLSNATANLGEGKLYLYGVPPANPQLTTHEVRQRVWRSDGSWYDRAAGQFVYHPGHNHIHIEGWAQYNLREILPGDGVGPILASGTKTSFCILDLRVQDDSLPGFDPSGEFYGCNSTVQGLSVGWADIYSRGLADQWIDVTGIADGTYWLESLADPAGHIEETDETNNAARIRVTIGEPAPVNPDPFEPNESIAAVLARPIGQNNSPHLGPCAPSRTLGGLTLHQSGDEDFFRFYLPAQGTASDFVRIDFVHALGDLELELFDEPGSLLAQSIGSTNTESIPLEGRAAGWYTARVYGYGGATHPAYTLTIDPPQSASPVVTVTSPPPGDTAIVQGIDSYTVRWSASDPDGNPLWASVWVNDVPILDGSETFLETSLNTPGEPGGYVLSSTYLPVGTYWVYVRITDGGSFTGAWSEGTLTLGAQPVAAPPPHGITRTHLLPAAPNPFNPSTTLELELAQDADLTWSIHDLRGAKVRTLVGGHLHAGRHLRRWDGRDDTGAPVASGVYYAVVRGVGVDLSRKLVLLK